jgi:hypothetical protein
MGDENNEIMYYVAWMIFFIAVLCSEGWERNMGERTEGDKVRKR